MVSFHIGAFCFDARQFGAFHFGDFHFDAVPVRRVSLWRTSTSARFSLARFPILYEPTMIRYLRTPVSRGLFVCMFPFRGEELSTSFCAHVSFRSSVVSILRACFLSAKKCFGAYLFLRSVSICAHVSYRSAKKCFLCQFDAFLVLRLCWSNMRVWHSVWCFFYARISFLRIFPLCVVLSASSLY